MPQRLAKSVAAGSVVVAGLLLIFAFAAALSLGWAAEDIAARGLLSIPILAVGFVGAGVILAWQRPANPIGWLLVSTGLISALTAWAIPATVVASSDGWPLPIQVALATVSYVAWTLWLVLIPLTLLVFPTGRIQGAAATGIAVLVVASGMTILLLSLADPGLETWVADLGVPPDAPLLQSGVIPPLGATFLAEGLWMLPTMFAIQVAALAGVVIVLVMRFIRGDEQVRRQLFWILLAALVIVLLAVTSVLATVVGPSFGLLALLPLPIGIMIAIVRVNLFDVKLVFSRALAWTILTLALIGAFFGLVAVLGTLLVQAASAVVAALVVALAFDPLRRQLQRLIDRLVYGRRSEPVYLVELLGSGISRATDMQGLVEALRRSLKLRWLAVRDETRMVAVAGEDPGPAITLTLLHNDEVVGWLEASPRAGERRLSRSDRDALALLAPVVAMLLRVSTVSRELVESRGRIVEATEDERRRLQRDLHDGVASALGGVAFKVEGIRNLVNEAPGRAIELLSGVHDDIVRASASLREVIHDLRPPELASLGLVGALREAASSLRAIAADRIVVVTVDSQPERLSLPAAIEVAVYRIGVEAVANALRHSTADEVKIDLALRPRTMSIRVMDNSATSTDWSPGVGLSSMRERTEMLGGRFSAGHNSTGGTVEAAIPLHPSETPDA